LYKNFKRIAKITNALYQQKKLLVFGGILRVFRYLYLGFPLITHGIQPITATQDKSSECKNLYMKKETGRRDPVSCEVCFFRLYFL